MNKPAVEVDIDTLERNQLAKAEPRPASAQEDRVLVGDFTGGGLE
jgi:hypothetical protein